MVSSVMNEEIKIFWNLWKCKYWILNFFFNQKAKVALKISISKDL